MMKLPIVFLAVLGLAFGKSIPTHSTKNLQDDLNDFLALVPVDDVLAIAIDYLANDAQVQELMVYVQSEEFHTIIQTVESLPEFDNFINFLNDLGLDVTGYINSIHDFIGLPHLPTIRKHMRRGVGVDGLIDDIIAILPIDDLRALFDSKLETSPDFKAFYDAIGSPEFQSIIQTLNSLPEFQALLQKLRDYGVDVDHYIELLRALFGLTKKSAIGTRNLQDDLNDFLALVPVDQVLAIGLDYLANDAQVRELVAYVQTEEFHSIILTVEALPEFSNFVSFLNDLGLDVTGYINSIHDFIGLPHLPTIRKHMRRGVGVDGLIDDIIAILPIDDLRALFDSKLETSPDFKAFYDAIGSPEFQSIIQTLNSLPEFQALLQKLRDYGVDVDHYIELLRALFGLTKKSAIGTRNLQDDLNDFLALVPVDQVLAIGLDYLANDAQVRELVAYVQTEEFHSIILTVEALPEFSNFVSFLNDLGLDVTGYINSIHDFIGLPHLPTIRKHMRRGVGVDGLIDDIIAILPIDDLRALFDSKLETSPDFKAFYDAIGSPEFQSIIQTLNSLPEFQALLQKLRDYGVDVDHYIELLRALFGLTKKSAIGTRNLQDDLNDFLALVPVDQVLAIGLDYLANDAQVRELVAYVQTEEFHSIILTVEALPEFSNFVSFLNDLGLDVTGYINSIHDFIGLPHLPTIRKHMRRGVGVDGLIDDIIAILPIDDLRALFDSKLETSPDFKAFYDAIGSPEFQSIIQTLNSLPEFQALLQKLRDYGVDVDHYIELLRALFGLTKKSAIGTRNLQDDLNDFLALVPVDQVLAIGLDYLANDAQVRELVAYVQTEEFHSIILTVEALPEFSNFVSFLNDLGLDVTGYINSIHDFIGLPHLPTIRKHMRRGVGVDGLIDDIIAILPIDDLRALFDSKLETSPDFKAFYDAIGSPEFQSIIQTLNSLPEFQALLQKLRDYGVDVDHYIELLRALFGLTKKSAIGTRNLQDDLNDFLALVPVDQVLAIGLDYLANDAQVRELVAYVQTEEFHSIILTVEALPEFSNFVSFLNDLGLDVTGYINSIHDFIGLPHLPTIRKHMRRGVGVDGLIDDIIAILPIDDLRALFDYKLETSPDFKAFYDAIGSPEFQSIIQTLNSLPEFQALLQKLRDYGVDVDHYIELLRALFGLTKKSAIGTRNLQDDLNDFLALVPVDQVVAIGLDYLVNDAQVRELVAYVQTEEFHSIILTVEALPEFSNFVSFLNDLGLDVTGYINSIHDFIGLPHLPTIRKHMRRGVGVDGLIDDIIAILPIDDLRALFDSKLETSPDFKAFYDAIGSPEFQSIIQTLNDMPEYQALLQKLRDYGVDVDHYIELLRALFGLTQQYKSTRNLQDDLNELIALIPVDRVLSIALDYLANDAQVQELMIYLQGDEFQTIVLTVEAVPAFGNIINFVKEHGLDVTGFINTLHDILGIPPYSPSSKNLLRRGVGINGFIEDIVAVIPLDQVLALFQDKLQNSADFQALYEEIHTPEFLTIIDALRGLQEYQDLLQRLRDYGVDVDYYIDLIMQLLGFSRRSTRNLQDDLNELIALIPVDRVLSIALDYLANDAQVQELMVYFQGDEFQTIVLTVEAVPAFGNIINFVKEHGLDVTGFINTLHDILGIPPYSPSSKNLLRRGVGINGFIEDIVAVIPLDQVLALFQDKLQNSADFQALYEEIHTPEFLTIIDALRGLQEYQDLLQRLRDYGVDVDYYIDLIMQLLGFSRRSTRNLQDDLNELIALIPVDRVLSIALDYLANDAQVQELMVYFQGDEFQTIVLTVEAVPAFGNIINFVKEHGLDVTGFINTLHDILGIPPYSPSSKNLLRRGVGINGFIEDIVAVIPLDQVLALFQDKLQNSADFQALYEEIHTPEFLTIIDALRGLQEYQDLLQRLRDYGVDVDYYIDLIMQLLGFSRRSTRNLQDDLNELIALIPVDRVLSIALDYLANDAQVQELMVYFQGDEFQTIVLTVEAVPAFGNIINFVKEHGLDVTGFINTLHDILGIPPYSPSSKNLLRRGVGINGFIEDIVAVIPLDQVLALFQDKLQNSADFQALYEEIHTPEFLTIIDTLKGMQEYQDLLQRLRDYGVDVDYYIDLIKQLLGFTKVVL